MTKCVAPTGRPQTLWRIGLAGLAMAVALIAPPARANIVSVYFGWDYVADSSGSAASELTLTSITYTGGNTPTAGLTAAMPAFPGYSGMPDGVGLTDTPTYTTTAGGDGETTRTISQLVSISWVPAGTVTPWGTYNFATIGITNFTTADGRLYSVDPNTANHLNQTTAPYYVVGLIHQDTGNYELDSLLAAPRGDIYDSLAGAVGNPQLTATDIPGFLSDQITVIFGDAVPEPASLALLGFGLVGLAMMRRRGG